MVFLKYLSECQLKETFVSGSRALWFLHAVSGWQGRLETSIEWLWFFVE
jgi:hypothetical protein